MDYLREPERQDLPTGRSFAAGESDLRLPAGTALPAPRSSEELRRGGKNFDHPVHFRGRVVKIKTGARCPRKPELAHQWLVTMVATAHCQAVLVRIRR